MLILSIAPRSATLVLALAATGCASRGVPTDYPAQSPASREAHAAPAARVTGAIDAEPNGVGDREALSPSSHGAHDAEQNSQQPTMGHSHEGHHGHP